MPDSVEKLVRETLVEVLAVDESEVTPQARFFADLNGESIDVLEMMFRFEKSLGVKVDFNAMFAGGDLTTNERGEIAAGSLLSLKTRFPFLAVDALPPAPTHETLRDLLTVDAIVNFVRDALERRASEHPVVQAATSPS